MKRLYGAAAERPLPGTGCGVFQCGLLHGPAPQEAEAEGDDDVHRGLRWRRCVEDCAGWDNRCNLCGAGAMRAQVRALPRRSAVCRFHPRPPCCRSDTAILLTDLFSFPAACFAKLLACCAAVLVSGTSWCRESRQQLVWCMYLIERDRLFERLRSHPVY